MTAQTAINDQELEALINFLVRSEDKPRVDIPEQGQGLTERSGQFEKRITPIKDARADAAKFSLDQNGFSFHQHKTDVVDFLDEVQVESLYYPEVKILVKEVTGAEKVHIFDHTIRIEDDKKRDIASVRAPVEVAHNDYTDKSGPQRIRDLFDAKEAKDWLSRRYAVVNVWRSIGGPAITTPLAVSDASTMQSDDFIPTDLVYKDRVGEIAQIGFSVGQRWYYFSEMTRDEALLIKCYDSVEDGRARFTAHTAFTNPRAPVGAPPRESIEVRTLIAF